MMAHSIVAGGGGGTRSIAGTAISHVIPPPIHHQRHSGQQQPCAGDVCALLSPPGMVLAVSGKGCLHPPVRPVLAPIPMLLVTARAYKGVSVNYSYMTLSVPQYNCYKGMLDVLCFLS